MTKLDDSIPFEDLLMVCPRPDAGPVPGLPEGYRWAEEPGSMGEEWAALMTTLGFPFSPDEARGKWRELQAPEVAARHFFVLGPEGDLAAACTLCAGKYPEAAPLRLHWVMTAEGHQRRGLSRTVCRAALAAADGRPVQLSTQAQSWPAVVLYESLGFRPWEHAWGDVPEGEAKARWARARKVAETHGARL